MTVDTFLTTLYVLVDDYYKAHLQPLLQRAPAGTLRMSDSEVLTLALAGQWRVGVPWRSERGLVRFMQVEGKAWFPTMLQRSAFNRRVRHLWAAFVALQQYVAAQLSTPEECVPSRGLCAVTRAHPRAGGV